MNAMSARISAAGDPKQRRSIPLALAVCCLLAPTIVAAQAAASRDKLEEVEVWDSRLLDPSTPTAAGSRLNLSIFETPASIEVIDGEIIRLRGDASIVDAVTRATGITSVANPGNGGTGLAARGFSGPGSVMQLYDGMRLYVGAGTVTFPFDPWTAERIEVLRGPASVLYGEGSIGGAVNIVPRQPNTQQHELQSQLTYGSHDTLHTAFGVGGPINSITAYRFDVSRNETDNWMDRGEAKSLGVAGTVRVAPSDSLSFVLSHDYGEQDPQQYFGTPLIAGELEGRNIERNYNVRDADIHYRDNMTRLRTNWQPASNVTVRNDLYRLTTDRLWRNAESYFWNGDTGEIDRFDYLGIEHDESQIGGRVDVSVEHALAGFDNTVLVGIEHNRVKFKHRNNFSGPTAHDGFSSVDPFDFGPGLFDDPVGNVPAYKTRSRQWAAFIEDRLALNERWSVVGGFRADRTKVRRDNLITGLRAFEETFDSVGWRLGVVAQVTPTLSFYGQYSKGADPLGSLITTSVAQKDFDLATAAQVEVGAKQSLWDNKVQWTLALYQIEKKKLLTPDPDNPGVSLQVGERSSRGVEATFAAQLTPTWFIDANIAVLDAEFDAFAQNVGGVVVSRNGNVPPGIPEETANAWVTWKFAPLWRAQAGVRYVGKTYSDNANDFEVPDYTVIDAAVEWTLTRNVRVALRGYNLTDEQYAETAYNDEQWILGQPRAGELAVNVSF